MNRKKNIVDAALTLDRLSLDWQVKLLPFDALYFVGRCAVGNKATTENMRNLVQSCLAFSPKYDYGPGNVNTGRECLHFMVGDEGSRVIYAVFGKAGTPADTEWELLALKLKREVAKDCECDECHVLENDDSFLKIRFWWD